MLQIPFTSEDQPFAHEVRDRLQALFPDLAMEVDDQGLIISGAETTEHAVLRQAIADQFIRARYAARTKDLRELLYRKLLT